MPLVLQLSDQPSYSFSWVVLQVVAAGHQHLSFQSNFHLLRLMASLV